MCRTFKLTLALLVLTALGVSAVRADEITLTGNTATGADGRFNRPVEGGGSLSAVGTNVPYIAYQFTVTASGSYNFLMTSQPPTFDTFLILYSGSFNPASGLANFVIGSDDLLGSLTQSGFAANLTAGTTYILVAAGFENSDAGAFRIRINGPGAINLTPIPEPATLTLLGLGLAGVSAAIGRKRRRHEQAE
jgi:hypothetical protein